jgi:glycosyltransferase involved in cell wall biosynthesis
VRIGVDYWPGATHWSGVGRYVREFTRALAALEARPDLRLLDVGPGARIAASHLGLDAPRVRRLRARCSRRALDLGAALGLGADRWLGGCELFHGVFPGLPRTSRARRTIALSELPHEPAVLREYDGVFAFSAWAREMLVLRCDLARERVHVVPPGADHWARERSELRERSAIPSIVVLGRLDRRRAPTAILAACERLRERGLALELAFLGRRGDAYDELRARVTRSPMCAAVKFVSEPDEAALQRSVHGARVLVHLSDAEWTAVTPLEALACGAAVVCGRIPTFVEALGPHAQYVDGLPDQVERDELAQAIERALAAPRPAVEFLERFTWKRNAELTLEAFGAILARARS